jgi:hypothetical protein
MCALVLAAACGGGIWWFVRSIDSTIADAYAVWNVAALVNEHLDRRNGKWPGDWDDLRRTLEQVKREDWTAELFDDWKRRVAIDWAADPNVLAAATPDGEKPPFRAIWLRDGRTAHWEGAEPNRLVWEHLQQRAHSTEAATQPATGNSP